MSCEIVAGISADGATILTDNQCRTLDIQNVLTLDDPMHGPTAACGVNACVYETKDPSTLVKVTSDWMDVWAMRKARNLPDVVPAKRMFKLKGKYRTVAGMRERDLYAIEVTRAKHLTPREELFINTVAFDANTVYLDQLRYGGAAPVTVDVADACRGVVEAARRQGKPYMTTDAADRAACESIVGESMGAVERLAKRGVYFTDGHSGNWGRHNGRLVAIDLGLSAPANTRTPRVSVLEGVMTDRDKQSALVAAGVAIALFLLLRPKKAKAEGGISVKMISALPHLTVIGRDPAFVAAYGPMREYEVLSGDSYSKIAKREFGVEELWPFLWDINRLSNSALRPDELEVGEVLLIPTRGSANRDYWARFDAHKGWYQGGNRGDVPADVARFTPISLG